MQQTHTKQRAIRFRPAHALIDLSALRHNLRVVRRRAPQQRIMAVVKANAYGHGSLEVAQCLERAGVDALAVACLEEALSLREAGIQCPIVLLEGFFHPDELPLIAQQALHVVLHTPQQVDAVLNCYISQPLSVWLKLDTGMHRLGLSAEEFHRAWQHLQACPENVQQIRLMTHLACADERDNGFTQQQCQLFYQWVKPFNLECSIANSAGVLAWPISHADWVRPGIMLYGSSPFNDTLGAQEHLKPVMQLRSALISIKSYSAGEGLGYGATWRCPEDMPVGMVAMGYADGYPRHAPSGTPVAVNGQIVPLIGRVSMDMLAVDLRQQPQAQIGDVVELWGGTVPVDTVARQAQTIAYELLSQVTQRVPRYVVDEEG